MLSACTPSGSIQLLSSTVVDFPAASGIEFYRDTLYVFGDNVARLFLLTPDHQPLGSFRFGEGDAAVLPKEVKPDIESAMLVEAQGRATLVGVGSMSGVHRWQVFEHTLGSDTVTQTAFFTKETRFPGIAEINVEGSTAVGKDVLFCNRANLSTRKNHLLLWNRNADLVVKEIPLPEMNGVPGMSGLYYVREKDLLFFTASEEATSSAYADGAIGDSYLGWIRNFSTVWKKGRLVPDGFLTLADFNKAFTRQKIESVCMESFSGRTYRLHLAADNDDGKTVLFKINVSL